MYFIHCDVQTDKFSTIVNNLFNPVRKLVELAAICCQYFRGVDVTGYII